MTTSRGHSARHEKNLERNVDAPQPTGGADMLPHHVATPAPGSDPAAQMARAAAEREAARRASHRLGSSA